MAMTREAKWRSKPPLHYELKIEHPPVELKAIRDESKRDIEDIRQTKKADLARIEEDCRRLEARVGRLGEYRAEMKSLGEVVLEACEGTKEEREKREAAEKAEEAKRKFQGMTKSVSKEAAEIA